MKISFIDPTITENWDKLILNFPLYSFFHSSDWAKLLQETYNFKPHYFLLENYGTVKAVLPLMEINSFFTGRRLISLPFSDFCEPLVSSDISLKRIRHRIIEHFKSKKFNSLELRDGETFMDYSNFTPAGYQHNLDLTISEDQLFKHCSDSTRRNIRKAIKNKISFEISNSLSALKEFYNMNCYTRRRHGLPPQPFRFFKNLHNVVLANNKGFISVAKYNGKSIASAVFLLIGNKALYKYGASLFEYQNIRPNNLLMWESIKYLKALDYKELNFGRTELENVGLRRFKLGWGSQEKILNYYRFDLGKIGSSNKSTISFSHKRIPLNKFPIPVLRLIGSVLYKHIA